MTVYVNDDEVMLPDVRSQSARSIVAAHGAQHPALAMAPPDRFYLERLPQPRNGGARPCWRAFDKVRVHDGDRFLAEGMGG